MCDASAHALVWRLLDVRQGPYQHTGDPVVLLQGTLSCTGKRAAQILHLPISGQVQLDLPDDQALPGAWLRLVELPA